MLVDGDNEAVTARQHPRLVLVVAELLDHGLRLTAPDQDPLTVAEPDGRRLEDVTLWGSRFAAAPASAEAAAWFSRVTGTAVRLVFLDDPSRRATDPRWSRPEDRVALSDGYPLLLATEESLAALNDWIATGPRADEGPVPMGRFRPNLVVAGAPAWSEDGWRRLRIGDTTFRAAKACDRCVFTLIDPVTAAKGKEPLATLARRRQWDHKTWFAINLLPDEGGGTLTVGDPVTVLEAAEADEPLH